MTNIDSTRGKFGFCCTILWNTWHGGQDGVDQKIGANGCHLSHTKSLQGKSFSANRSAESPNGAAGLARPLQ
jgi:hypothetical protein